LTLEWKLEHSSIALGEYLVKDGQNTTNPNQVDWSGSVNDIGRNYVKRINIDGGSYILIASTCRGHTCFGSSEWVGLEVFLIKPSTLFTSFSDADVRRFMIRQRVDEQPEDLVEGISVRAVESTGPAAFVVTDGKTLRRLEVSIGEKMTSRDFLGVYDIKIVETFSEQLVSHDLPPERSATMSP
jgi:hypothetical protein